MRDPRTEGEIGVGFGFWPDNAKYLVIFAVGHLMYSEVPTMATHELLIRVAKSFVGAGPSAEQAPSNWATC